MAPVSTVWVVHAPSHLICTLTLWNGYQCPVLEMGKLRQGATKSARSHTTKKCIQFFQSSRANPPCHMDFFPATFLLTSLEDKNVGWYIHHIPLCGGVEQSILQLSPSPAPSCQSWLERGCSQSRAQQWPWHWAGRTRRGGGRAQNLGAAETLKQGRRAQAGPRGTAHGTAQPTNAKAGGVTSPQDPAPEASQMPLLS
jgi:hypothetical protein